MKKIWVFLLGFLLFALPALAQSVTTGSLVYDNLNTGIQGFSPDPDKAKVAATVAASQVTSIITIGWTAVMFSSTEDSQVWFNGLTTKYMTFPADQKHVIVLNNEITSVVIKNAGTASATITVWGM